MDRGNDCLHDVRDYSYNVYTAARAVRCAVRRAVLRLQSTEPTVRRVVSRPTCRPSMPSVPQSFHAIYSAMASTWWQPRALRIYIPPGGGVFVIVRASWQSYSEGRLNVAGLVISDLLALRTRSTQTVRKVVSRKEEECEHMRWRVRGAMCVRNARWSSVCTGQSAGGRGAREVKAQRHRMCV